MQEVAGIVVADSAVDLILDFIELLGQRIKAGEGGIQRIGTGKAGPGAGRGHEGTHIFKSLLLQCGVCLFRKVGGQGAGEGLQTGIGAHNCQIPLVSPCHFHGIFHPCEGHRASGSFQVAHQPPGFPGVARNELQGFSCAVAVVLQIQDPKRFRGRGIQHHIHP